MKKQIHLLLLVLVLPVLLSFTSTLEKKVVGTYGAKANGIELVLLDNHTFTYKDFSSTKNKIDVSGTWAIEKNRVVLAPTSKKSIHNNWKIIEPCSAIKSRKGLTFYTLARIK